MNFIVYSKPNCQHCYKIKQVLELSASDFVVYNLEQHFTKEEFYSKFGEASTFPQVVCENVKIGGCLDTINFLKKNKVV